MTDEMDAKRQLTKFSTRLFFNWRRIGLQCCVGFCHTTHKSAIIIHISPPSPSPSHPSKSSQRMGLGSLCYRATSHQLLINPFIFKQLSKTGKGRY